MAVLREWGGEGDGRRKGMEREAMEGRRREEMSEEGNEGRGKRKWQKKIKVSSWVDVMAGGRKGRAIEERSNRMTVRKERKDGRKTEGMAVKRDVFNE
jgi:hypothetical protein